MTNKIELNAERVTRGELAGSWRVAAYRGNTYLGNEVFMGYTKSEALRLAREIVKAEEGLGIYRKSLV